MPIYTSQNWRHQGINVHITRPTYLRPNSTRHRQLMDDTIYLRLKLRHPQLINCCSPSFYKYIIFILYQVTITWRNYTYSYNFISIFIYLIFRRGKNEITPEQSRTPQILLETPRIYGQEDTAQLWYITSYNGFSTYILHTRAQT
jgi:hypothetical protein